MLKQALLAVLAHPDDESFGMGGTLAYYASRGVEVHLICATRGEVGEVAPEMLEGYRSIADLRESELRCAAGILGLAGVHFLDYRDSGMTGSSDNHHPQALAAQPLDEVVQKISGYIHQLEPQVILTFDPIGGYLHPDHVAIQRATVSAFEQSVNGGGSPAKLFFFTFPKRLMRVAVKLMPLFGKDPHTFGSNGDIDATKIVEVDYPIHARIDVRSVIDRKEKAGACHASQGGGQNRGGLLSFVMRRFNGTESFMQAYPPVHGRVRIARDLFGDK
jgi:N-acetyl-1-D-myo-inositol-2-amino-2-deoxy-alpha-D-glucopyranoside deacetylase